MGAKGLLFKGLIGTVTLGGASVGGLAAYTKGDIVSIFRKKRGTEESSSTEVDSSIPGGEGASTTGGSSDGQDGGDVQITTGGSDTQDPSTDDQDTGGSGDTVDTQDTGGAGQDAGGEGASTTGGSSDTQDTGDQQAASTTGGSADGQDAGGSGQGTGGGSTDDQAVTGGSGQGTGGSADTVDTQDTGGSGQGTGGQASTGQGQGTQQPATTGSGDLGFPETCGFKDATETKTCDLTKEDLEKIKFAIKSGSSKVEVSGLNTNNKVKVTVTNITDTTYNKGKKYTFTTESDDKVKISNLKGGKEITLEKGKSFNFKENNNNKLEYVADVDKFGVPNKCVLSTSDSQKTCELSEEEIKNIKFKDFDDSKETSVTGVSTGNKVTLKIEKVTGTGASSYPSNKKYTLSVSSAKVTITNGSTKIEVDKGKEVNFKESSGKLEKIEGVDNLGIPEDRCKLSGSSKECDLSEADVKKLKLNGFDDGKITVEGLSGNKKIKLKIETSSDTTNYPKGKKYTLTNKNDTDVKIKNDSKDKGAITLNKTSGTATFKENNSSKLEKVREVNTMGIPKDCKDNVDCDLYEEDIKKLKFGDTGTVTVSGLKDNESIKVKMVGETDKTIYPKGKKYTFSNKNSTQVTIKVGSKEIVKLTASTGSADFREVSGGNKLERTPTEDEQGIPYTCKAHEVKKSGDTQTCQLTAEQLKKVKFKERLDSASEVTVTGLSGNIQLTVEHSDDKTKYPTNKKYTFDNSSNTNDLIIVSKLGSSEGTTKIEKKKKASFKVEGKKLNLVESKSSIEIEREKKIKEVNEALVKAGLTKDGLKLQMSDFSDENKPTKHKDKTVEFWKDDELKKIQFKELGGGASKISVLESTGKSLKLHLKWTDETSKFPHGMKFVFENLNVSPNIAFEDASGKKKVEIEKKLTNTPEQTFKMENYQLVKVTGSTRPGGEVVISGREKLNNKIRNLNLNCLFGEEEYKSDTEFRKECKLSKEEIEKAKFVDNLDKDAKVVAHGLGSGEKIKLVIEYTDDTEDFPDNVKFTLKNKRGELELKSRGSGDKKILNFQQGLNPEFRNKDGRLLWAWDDINHFAKKVGMRCVEGTSTCAFVDGAKVNVKDGKKVTEGAEVEVGKTMKHEKVMGYYFQWYRFSPEKRGSIKLMRGGKPIERGSGEVEKIYKGKKYEIKRESGKWYLVARN